MATDDSIVLVEQYASQVVDFSSQYGSDHSFSYTASNCLGRPSQFPNYGDFHETFVLREFGDFWERGVSGQHLRRCYSDNPDCCQEFSNFIDLKYKYEVQPQICQIFETFNPGSVHAIYGGNDGTWQCLWKKEKARYNEQVTCRPRAFSPPLNPSNVTVNVLRIVFCHKNIHGHSEIDAVALLGTKSGAKVLRSYGKTGAKLKLPRTAFKAFRPVDALDLDHAKLISFGHKLIHRQKDVSGSEYFGRLPDELILKIFTTLDLITLCRCCGVSRRFLKIASSSSLFSKICLKKYFSSVTDLTLRSLVSRCSGSLTHFDLSWCGNYAQISSAALTTFLAKCKNLINLRLNNCHAATTGDFLSSLPSFLSGQLEELSLGNCHLIKSSQFSVLKEFKMLKHVNLQRTQITQNHLLSFIEAAENLLTLNVAACNELSANEILVSLGKNQPGN